MYCYLFPVGDQGDTVDKTFTAYSPLLGSRVWRMVVHEQHTLPAVFDKGFDILPGRSTAVALSSTQISRLPSPYTDCLQDKVLPNTNYKTTPSACRKHCMSRITERECGCIPVDIVPYHYPGLHYCLTYNYSDPMKVFVQKQCENNVQSENASERISNEIKDCEKACLWRYEEVQYNRQTTTSIFPTPEVMAWFYTLYIYDNTDREKLLAWQHFNDRVVPTANKTAEEYRYNTERWKTVVTPKMEEWITDSFARVNVYFEDVTVLRKKQTPSYNWNDLLADIGGVLGLWVGVSVITIFEFLTLLSQIILLSCKKRQ